MHDSLLHPFVVLDGVSHVLCIWNFNGVADLHGIQQL